MMSSSGKISVYEFQIPLPSISLYISLSAEQRPGFQSTGKKVEMQDDKLHKGPR